MVGETPFPSFIKRRMGAAPSSRLSPGSEFPEALVPLLALQRILELTAMQIVAITLAFFVLEIPLAWLTHRFGLRDRPY